MNPGLSDLILGFEPNADGLGKYVARICKEHTPQDIERETLGLLHSRNYDVFTRALDFFVFLYNRQDFIPGDRELPVIDHIERSGRIEQSIWEELTRGHYAKSIHYMYHLNRLPIDMTTAKLEQLFESFMVAEPLLIKELLNYYMENLTDGAFPKQLYDRIRFDDPVADCVAKYNAIEYSNVDSLTREELFRDLQKTATVFTDEIEAKIRQWTQVNSLVESEIQEEYNRIDKSIMMYLETSIEKMLQNEKAEFFAYLSESESP